MFEETVDAPTQMSLEVECYAGYRGEETPRRFYLHDRCFTIEELLDCWLGPGHRYFKVVADDDCIYILRHDTGRDQWELTMFATRSFLDFGESAP
jgi:hypothetical protein